MVYFDNAATTFPKPNIVLTQVQQAIVKYGGNPGRGGHDMAMRVSEKVYGVRSEVASFFNAESQNVIFTSNCTAALNIAIKGIVKKGDHFVVSCLEHNSVLRPIYKLSQSGIITYDIARVYEDDDMRTVAEFESLIKMNTRAIICTHASNVVGNILPIKMIGALCKKAGILFIVDAAQTAGVIPIDIKDMNIDILCTAGHKGLYGITGTGLLVLNRDIILDSLMEGGTGSKSSELEQPDFYPDRLEAGTGNTPGIFSIGAGISFIKSVGIDKIYSHEFNLCSHLYKELSKIEKVKLYQKSYVKYRRVPLVAFNIGNMSSEESTGILNMRKFALRGGLHCAPLAHQYYNTSDIGMVRFAPSIFTNSSSVDEFVKIIREVSKISR